MEVLDLHGYPLATAKTLVRFHLDLKRKKEAEKGKEMFAEGLNMTSPQFIIVTGKGNHVLPDGRSGVLRKEISHFLKEDLNLKVTVPGENTVRVAHFIYNVQTGRIEFLIDCSSVNSLPDFVCFC